MLTAADRAGFEPYLAAHHRFRSVAELPPHWNVRPVYRHRTYSRYRFGADLEAAHGQSALRWSRDWWLQTLGRRRHVGSFARSSAQYFRDNPLAAGDQVFVATVSELELLGLGKFLQQLPPRPDVDWHVQFHFPIYSGCEPDYSAQERRLRSLRRMVRQAVALAAGHRLHFYTTTEPLSVQHNRLGAGPFHTLPYPVNPTLRKQGRIAHRRRQDDCGEHSRAALASAPHSSPLQVAFLGGVRHEKGYHHLPRIIDSLWREYVEPGRIRFHVQSDFDFSLPASPANKDLVEARAALGRLPSRAITLLDEPLDSETYCRLATHSDIGLLPYEPRPYHARCSGVLVEFLAAGVPVVVPAGCWMADQLAKPNREYHLSLCDSPQALAREPIRQRAAVPLPAHTAAIVLLARWPSGAQLCPGAYARLEATFFAAGGNRLASRPAIVGPAQPGRLNTAVIRVPAQAASVAIEWGNAYSGQCADFSDVEACFLTSNCNRPLPLGAVGLTAVDSQQFPEMLAEMIDHHSHYRQTAQAFADGWSAWYSPTQVVTELLARTPRAGRGRSANIHKPHLRVAPAITAEFAVPR